MIRGNADIILATKNGVAEPQEDASEDVAHSDVVKNVAEPKKMCTKSRACGTLYSFKKPAL